MTVGRPRGGATAVRAGTRRARMGERPRAWTLAILAAAVAVAFGFAQRAVPYVVAVGAWDLAALAMLGSTWWGILTSDAARSRARAAEADPGRTGVLVITAAACTVALGISVALLAMLGDKEPGDPVVTTLFVLGLVAVISAWALVHTAFAVHYAHLYYRDDGDPGGLEFPRTPEPDDFDFAYFSFMIGTAFGGSDVGVADRGIRRVVLGHAVLSFAFNTAILALVLEMVSGAFS